MSKKQVEFSESELLYIRDLYESVNEITTMSEFLEAHGEGKIVIGDFAKKFAGVHLHSIETKYESEDFDGRELMFLSAMAIICNVHLLVAIGTLPGTESPIQALKQMGFSSVDGVTDIYLKINRMLGDREDDDRERTVVARAKIEQAELDRQ